MRASHVWRGRCIAPAHEGPRNHSNNKAHEPTSGRSTRYGSGHLIRVFRDIWHIFSSQCPSHWRFCFLVVLPCPRDLLLCAKHLFGVAMVAKDLWGCRRRAARARAWRRSRGENVPGNSGALLESAGSLALGQAHRSIASPGPGLLDYGATPSTANMRITVTLDVPTDRRRVPSRKYGRTAADALPKPRCGM
jgi:hypothetical protein